MSTWSLTRIPYDGSATVTQSLTDWGLAGGTLKWANWDIDTLDLVESSASIATDDPIFAYRDKIILSRNGTNIYHGWLMTAPEQAAVQADGRTYHFVGPGWWLTQYPPSYDPTVTIYTIGGYLTDLLGTAVGAGAPISYDTSLGAIFDAMCPEVRKADTILAAVQSAVRYSPLAAGWWDYSGDTPILRGALRAGLTATTLAIGADWGTTIESLARRDDLRLDSVLISCGWTGSASSYYNTAGANAELKGPNRLHVALSFGSAEEALAAAGRGAAEKLYAALSAAPWVGQLTLCESTDPLPLLRPGYAINLSGGRTAWETMAAAISAVTLTIAPEATDTMQIELGVPAQLGVQDYMEFADLASGSASLGKGTDPDETADALPGTYDDLNGSGTGGSAPLGSIAVQSRGGSWELRGIPAWDGSPRRFGLNTWSGALVYSGDGCSTTTTYSGAGSCHPATGATASTLTRHISQGGCFSGTEYTYYAYDTLLWTYVSATTNAVTATAIVCTAVASPGYGASGSGVARADLSDEDTPDSAIARMLATAEWGSATTAIRTIPTTGITGLYREARYRTEHTETEGQQIWVEGQWVDGTWVPGRYRTAQTSATYPTLVGLTPWQRYQVTISVEIRPVDSAGSPTGDGSWSAAGTRQHYIQADINGEGGTGSRENPDSGWIVIEPTAGYETRLGTPHVEAA